MTGEPFDREHDGRQAEPLYQGDEDIGTLPASRGWRFGRRAGYVGAGLLGAAILVGAVGLVVWLSPDGIAQDNSAQKTEGVPKPRPKPKPAAKPAEAPVTQAQPAQKAEQPAPAAQPAGTPNPVETPFMAHARQAGLTTCGAVYPALGQLLTQGSEYMVQSQWNRGNPNAFPLQALVGMSYKASNYQGPAIGAIFATPNGPRCEGDMVRIVPLQQDCAAAAATLPQGTKQVANLSNIPVLELPNGGGQVAMMSAGPICVAVTFLRIAR